MECEEFLKEVKSSCKASISELDSSLVDKLFSKLPQGKMLRSKLIFAIANSSDMSIKLATIVELIHLASLLHDDVIDDALTRRGFDSINSIYGNKSAIMLGDILYSKAFYELSSWDSDIAKIVSQSVVKLSIGELLDVELAKEFNGNLELYFDMIYKKTASLIEATSECAAIIAKKDAKSYREYGKNLGIAFQIVDDILDITQDSELLGKPALNDLREGKSTIAYIYLFEKLDKNQRERFLDSFGKEFVEAETIWIKEVLNSTLALERCKNVAKEYAKNAIDAVGDEPRLIEIVQKMIQREY